MIEALEKPSDSKNMQKPSSEMTYTLEMIKERDDFIGDLDNLRTKVQALEAAGLIPKGVAINRYGVSKTQIFLGSPDENLEVALRKHMQEKESGDESPMIVIEYDDIERIGFDPNLVNGSTVIKVSRIFSDADGKQVTQGLSFLNNGYVRRFAEKEGATYIHRADADELIRMNAQPTIPVRVPLDPLTGNPAELIDLQFDRQAVADAVSSYGLEA